MTVDAGVTYPNPSGYPTVDTTDGNVFIRDPYKAGQYGNLTVDNIITCKQLIQLGAGNDSLEVIFPSGDTTGAKDTSAIQGALNQSGIANLAPGVFYTGVIGSTTTGLTIPIGTPTNPFGGVLRGSGHGLTFIFYVGNGIGISSHGTVGLGTSEIQGYGAILQDFTLDGSLVPAGMGATSAGIELGDQPDCIIWDVTIQNFTSSGSTSSLGSNPLGAVGLHWNNFITWIEKHTARVATNNCTNHIQYSTHGGSTSRMYSDSFYHVNTQPHQNGIVIARQGHVENGRLRMRGNFNCDSNPALCAAIVLGVPFMGGGSPQQGHLIRLAVDIHVETDGGAGGNTLPFTIAAGSNSDNQILECGGRLQFLDGWQNSNLTAGNFGWRDGVIHGDTSLPTLNVLNVPVSGILQTNTGVPVQVVISGGTGVSIMVNGVNVGSAGTFIVPFNGTFQLTYSTVPTVVFIPLLPVNG